MKTLEIKETKSSPGDKDVLRPETNHYTASCPSLNTVDQRLELMRNNVWLSDLCLKPHKPYKPPAQEGCSETSHHAALCPKIVNTLRTKQKIEENSIKTIYQELTTFDQIHVSSRIRESVAKRPKKCDTAMKTREIGETKPSPNVHLYSVKETIAVTRRRINIGFAADKQKSQKW
ncbi:hypothetical protein L596_019382 [Steinernema carpocapsae]|uniref:Uncharacterized protein n=1 Tax=Steinernema carpocapsae TaxID=34508 RepID=A0A4U5MQB9_STECR|nr:hypothetical protein L596_019382 [Steinernema carpocapsae]